ncbi:MAG: hypothetical protein JSU86_06720 [Phycisphaerales bacterium]|nr:MAG: hypothetical protein JSU86_06720 [Phycisphaerales bacterium]
MKTTRNLATTVLLMLVVPGIAGCGECFVNLTASLGGDWAGERGAVRVLFINNTPHRAVFTFGSYDQADQFSQPDFAQFGLSEFGATLEGDSSSQIISIECARVFSIGGPGLLTLIEQNLSEAALDDDAFVEGVEFFSISSDGADGDDSGDPVNEGSAPPFEALLGVDFPCNALLIVRFEFDDLGHDPFRVDFELIPSESTR